MAIDNTAVDTAAENGNDRPDPGSQGTAFGLLLEDRFGVDSGSRVSGLCRFVGERRCSEKKSRKHEGAHLVPPWPNLPGRRMTVHVVHVRSAR